jgi:hypothetical protein
MADEMETEQAMAEEQAPKAKGSKSGKRFEIKKWNAVAMWSWAICTGKLRRARPDRCVRRWRRPGAGSRRPAAHQPPGPDRSSCRWPHLAGPA